MIKEMLTGRQKKRALSSLIGVVVFGWVFSAPFLSGKKARPGKEASRLTIPSGTAIEVKMIDELDTAKSHLGDSFQASLTKPLAVNGWQLASRNSIVRGKIADVVSSGRLKRPASITIKLIQLSLSNGSTISLDTVPYTLDGKSHALRNATLIGGGTAAGAILGGVAGGNKGALIGSAVGGGAGAVTAYLTGKQEIVIPSETSLSFTTVSSSPISSWRPDGENSQSSGDMFVKGKGDRGGTREIVFTDHDRRIIRDFFRGRYSNLPPGLAKRGGQLPPGLEKQLQRNHRLPPGLEKHVEPFPQELETRLPSLPDRTSRVVLGRRAMIVDDQNKILDMIDDILI
jgi:hypothetical protein